jgi:hypothetical protein
MPDALVPCLAVNHMNFAVDDFDEARYRLGQTVDAQFVMDIPRPEWHAGLVYFAGVIVELFAPTEGLLTSRYGPHYVGLEFQIPDVDEARTLLRDKGIRLVRDIGVAIHTHPADCHGIAFEFFNGNFHTDPDIPWDEPLAPRERWSEQHPMRIAGMGHYTLATADVAATSDFLRWFGGGEIGDAVAYPGANAEGRRVRLGDTIVEVVAPMGAGPMAEQLYRYGPGIRSLTLTVADVAAAEAHLHGLKVSVLSGDREGSIAFDASPTGGLRIELSE